jgi:hypothetical protein
MFVRGTSLSSSAPPVTLSLIACVRACDRNLIPRLQRAIRVARRANFLLYGDVGYDLSHDKPSAHNQHLVVHLAPSMAFS